MLMLKLLVCSVLFASVVVQGTDLSQVKQVSLDNFPARYRTMDGAEIDNPNPINESLVPKTTPTRAKNDTTKKSLCERCCDCFRNCFRKDKKTDTITKKTDNY